MLVDVKTRNEDGDIIFEGTLNRREVGFLLQFAINDLMMAGVTFNLQEQNDANEANSETEDEPIRFVFPGTGKLDS